MMEVAVRRVQALLAPLLLLVDCTNCTNGPSSQTSGTATMSSAQPGPTRGTLLEDLTWIQAEKALTRDTVVVLPLGAASKEHGPHLRLKNDLLLAEYFKKRVLEAAEVVVAPTLGYHFYPAFVEYPGSTTLRLETARDLTIDVVESLARHGPRRFYVLNTGVSTVRALAPAAAALAEKGILLTYTNLKTALGGIEKQVLQQEGGTHADEGETSMMLVIAPETVDMSRAVKDYREDRPGGLTRDPNGPGTYSPTGIWGDATLATREKGQVLVDGLTQAMLRDIEELRKAPLPEAAPASSGSASAGPVAPFAPPAAPRPPRAPSPPGDDPLGRRH
jgi:creatinine amidohydrolase